MIHENHRCQAKLVAVALCFALFLALPSEVRAQTLYGSIVGNVKDASDTAIVGRPFTFTTRTPTRAAKHPRMKPGCIASTQMLTVTS